MSTESSLPADGDVPECSEIGDHSVVEVAKDGDIVLVVTFETSLKTLNKSRKAALTTGGKPRGSQVPLPEPLKPSVKVAYRVSLEALKRHSHYFSHLLSNPRFREARLIADTHDDLAKRDVRPAQAAARDLPSIAVMDDDEATQAAAREHVFEDMLRIVHQKSVKSAKVTMSYATTLAILADRFDCLAVVSRGLNSEHNRFKWPVTSNKPFRDDRGRTTDVENVLRQKILVSWLLGQPLRLYQATREIIMRGSNLWGVCHDTDADVTAAWWNLPEGLEDELRYRRRCILETIASVHRHFLDLYASRDRQCRLGYDSSAACDSFQLGQMLKFLTSKGLLLLVDFSPASLDSVPDTWRLLDIEELITTLKQCPNYQIDKHHTNCGPQIRMKPILDYVCTMLSANVIWIPHADWKKRRAEVSWASSGGACEESGRTFAFTRAIAHDQRLRYEGVLHADHMAKSLFTAASWDWTPEA